MNRVRGVKLWVLVAAAGAGVLVVGACATKGRASGPAPLDAPVLADAAPRNYEGLHNVVAYHEGYYSGSAPEGREAFVSLARLGIRTIITVDGAAPDVEAAKAEGIRYIHLPIGYNGFDEARRRELARATRDALRDGPVYIHCHHGKHRSAGAAGAVAVSLGWMTPDEAVARMKVSGTAPNYTGLYSCAANAGVLSGAEIERVPANFPEVVKPTGLVENMVHVDEAMEHLKAIEKAGWKAPADHPDLVPVAEAGRVADLLRFLHDNARVKAKPEGFRVKLDANQALAQRLEDQLAEGTSDAAALSKQFKAVAASCVDCHKAYRD